MTDGNFYDKSVKLGSARDSLVALNTAIAKMWLFRHALLVAASPKGLACHYARQARTFSEAENELECARTLLREHAALLLKTADEL